jgi:hypothetical protein
MRKHAILLALTALELLALVLLAFFALVMRPDLAATYGLGTGTSGRTEALPLVTKIVLGPWFPSLVGGAGVLLFAAAWLPGRRPSSRKKLLGASLVVTVLGLGWAIWVAYIPAFERLTAGARYDKFIPCLERRKWHPASTGNCSRRSSVFATVRGRAGALSSVGLLKG